jgi:hypothetical protein
MAISEIRQRIADIALAESNEGQPPFGKVTDYRSDPENLNYRYGWKRLKEYFDAAVLGWGPGQWTDPTKRLFRDATGNPHKLTNLEGIKLRGMRIPGQGGDGIQWCGIFATWVLLRAFAGGVVVQWKLGVGPVGPAMTLIKGNEGIHVGDICVKKGDLVHHFIPYNIAGNGVMQTVNGNSDWQSILTKPLPIKDVAYYYRVDAD